MSTEEAPRRPARSPAHRDQPPAGDAIDTGSRRRKAVGPPEIRVTHAEERAGVVIFHLSNGSTVEMVPHEAPTRHREALARLLVQALERSLATEGGR